MGLNRPAAPPGRPRTWLLLYFVCRNNHTKQPQLCCVCLKLSKHICMELQYIAILSCVEYKERAMVVGSNIRCNGILPSECKLYYVHGQLPCNCSFKHMPYDTLQATMCASLHMGRQAPARLTPWLAPTLSSTRGGALTTEP